MGQRANATRPETDLSGVGLRIGQELGNCFGGDRWIHSHNLRLAADGSDGRDVANKIVIELVVERGAGCVRCTDKEKRIAVRGCFHSGLSADGASGTGSVLDNEWLAKSLGQPLTDPARLDVVIAACGNWDDDTHWPRRIALRPCD